jgi:hypothetical protein
MKGIFADGILIGRLRGELSPHARLVAGTGGEVAEAWAEVLDRPDPVARGPDNVDVDREVPEDRDAETAGYRLRREEHVRRDETDLDEVGPGGVLLGHGRHGHRVGTGVERRQDFPRHREQGRRVVPQRKCAGRPLLEHLRGTGHLAEAGDPIGQHQLQRPSWVLELQRVGVHVEVTGYEVLAGYVDRRAGGLAPGVRDAGDAVSGQRDVHVRRERPVPGVDDGHPAQGSGAHRPPFVISLATSSCRSPAR